MAETYAGEINGILINYFEENINTLSQKLSNELKKSVKIKYKIGENFETAKNFYPEKHGKPKPETLNHQASLVVNTLEHYLKIAKKDQYFSLLNKLFETPDGQSVKDMELFYSISMVLLRYINSQKLIDKIAKRISLYNLTQSNEHSSPSETVEYIRNLSEIIFETVEEQEKQRAEKIVNMLIRHIHENLHEDLSLSRLSEEVHYNPTYLSRLFKQEAGVNISDFILSARINKAKELLTDGKLKINKVANMVGYESAHSFARTFKNTTGISPQEYKNSKL